eukprot:XP_014633139.1 transcription factor bHLH68 isoform X4 [Glycine max]
MMAGNPNWWTMHPPSLIPPQYVLGSSSIPFNSSTQNQEPPHSLSQLLFTGLPGEEERVAFSHFQSKKLDEWNEQMLNPSSIVPMADVIKQEVSQSGNLYHHGHDQEFQVSGAPWSHMVPVSSSPRSSVASFSSNNLLDFTYNKTDHRKNQLPDHTSECNSTATGGVYKKTKSQPSSSQPPLKTDTASVLLEAIGYIRFLQGQIEALSSPYLGNGSKNMRNPQSVHGERNSVFPEDPGQLLNDNGLKRKGAPNQDAKDKPRDLKSRGLCLVPVSCTQHVGNENGADYWAPAYGSGF